MNTTNIDTQMQQEIQMMDLSAPAPMQEPQRQYYFLKRARELTAGKERELGRPLTCCVTTFGC